MKIMLDKGAVLPTRGHPDDAGLDLRAKEGFTEVISPHSSACFDTGVHMEIPKGYVGFIKSRSGLNVKHSIQTEGVIDSGYTGSIVVKLYNNGDETVQIKGGDRIAQIVILPILYTHLEVVSELDGTERGNGGFGSTGR